ncbi:MAG: CPBP family intramembrane metalloprotease [Clostridia bacterium]|nr:CPBP family intramembrane metalloprotease [Clostridia bacterium]
MKLKSNTYAPILFGVILILVGIASILSRVIERVSVDAFLSSAIVQLIVFLLPIAFYCRVRGSGATAGLNFRFTAFKSLPFILNMALIFFVGSMLLRYVGLFFFEEAMVKTPDAVCFSAKSSNSFLHVLGTMILPAVLEEVAFRGILLEEYRPYGASWSVAISSLMFAMLHLSFENFAYYLFMGVVLGVITLASDSVLPAVALHLGISASHEYIRPAVVEYLRQAGKSMILPYLLLALFLILFVSMFSGLENIYQSKAFEEILQSRKELLRKELEKVRIARDDTPKESKGKAFLRISREIFLSPTFLVCIVLFIFLASDVLK